MPKQVMQENFLDKITMVEQTTKTVATQDALTTAVPGNGVIEGPTITGPEAPQLPSAGNGTINVPAPEKPETSLPSRQPQFPGGTAAWLNFLNRHLTPPQDLEPGEKRTVLIRFSVDEEGIITNFQVVQSGGGSFDNEVIRVLKKMPKWLPALQYGKPVAVSFTQPVTFAAAEE